MDAYFNKNFSDGNFSIPFMTDGLLTKFYVTFLQGASDPTATVSVSISGSVNPVYYTPQVFSPSGTGNPNFGIAGSIFSTYRNSVSIDFIVTGTSGSYTVSVHVE